MFSHQPQGSIGRVLKNDYDVERLDACVDKVLVQERSDLFWPTQNAFEDQSLCSATGQSKQTRCP